MQFRQTSLSGIAILKKKSILTNARMFLRIINFLRDIEAAVFGNGTEIFNIVKRASLNLRYLKKTKTRNTTGPHPARQIIKSILKLEKQMSRRMTKNNKIYGLCT